MLGPATSVTECRFCGAPMFDHQAECSTCGKARKSTTMSEWNAFTSGTNFAALWVCSVGLYLVLWYYRAWKFLRIEMREDVRPLFRTPAMFLPIVGQVMMFRLVKDISWFTTKSEGNAFLTVMFVWGMFVVARIVDRFGSMWAVPLSMAAGFGIWTVQRRINEYCRTNGIMSAPMPVYGWIICGVGAVIWVFAAIGLIWGDAIAE